MTYRQFLLRMAHACMLVWGCAMASATAHAKDLLERVADEVNGHSAGDHLMPVEACYVNQDVRGATGYNLFTVRSDMPGYGLVIRYVRAFNGLNNVRSQAPLGHKNGWLPILDAQASGKPIVRTALARRPNRDSERISVLRYGEECTMWLPPPPPGFSRWMVVVGRVLVRSGGTEIDVITNCVKNIEGETVDCEMRLDTVNYSEPELYGERIGLSGTYYYDTNINWSLTPP